MTSTEASRMCASAPAVAAVKAAKNANRWGLFAALRYAIKHGASFAMFDQARKIEERLALHRRLQQFEGWLA